MESIYCYFKLIYRRSLVCLKRLVKIFKKIYRKISKTANKIYGINIILVTKSYYTT